VGKTQAHLIVERDVQYGERSPKIMPTYSFYHGDIRKLNLSNNMRACKLGIIVTWPMKCA
jgi:hypothetical protein